jgi:hypothetical protein
MTSRLSDVPPCFDRLNDSYDDLVIALKREKEAQDAEVRAAWAEIEQARQEIRAEWRRVDAEKARLFPSSGAAALPYTGGRTLDGGGRGAHCHPPHHEANNEEDDNEGGGSSHRHYEQPSFAPSASATPSSSAAAQRQQHPASTSPLKRATTSPHQRRHYAHTYDDRVNLSDAEAGVVRSPSHLNTSGGGGGNNGMIVFVWNGIQRAGEPKRLALLPFRSMQQLLERAAQETMAMPAGELVAPDGRRIQSIAELRDRGDYLVMPSGCAYREEAVPTALLRKLVMCDGGKHSGSTALRRHATS